MVGPEDDDLIRHIAAVADPLPIPITVADPAAADAPLIYVNDAFSDLTGFAWQDAVGRNCRFLQGKDTQPSAVDEIRRAIAEKVQSVECLLNYRHDGSSFHNLIYIDALWTGGGRALLLGCQQQVDDDLAPEFVQAYQDRMSATKAKLALQLNADADAHMQAFRISGDTVRQLVGQYFAGMSSEGVGDRAV